MGMPDIVMGRSLLQYNSLLVCTKCSNISNVFSIQSHFI